MCPLVHNQSMKCVCRHMINNEIFLFNHYQPIKIEICPQVIHLPMKCVLWLFINQWNVSFARVIQQICWGYWGNPGSISRDWWQRSPETSQDRKSIPVPGHYPGGIWCQSGVCRSFLPVQVSCFVLLFIFYI